MFSFILGSMLSVAQAASGLDIVGYWSKVGECGSKVLEFDVAGTMTHYEYQYGRYTVQSSSQWWVDDGYIFVGNKAADIVVMGIKVDSVNSLLFSGTMVFADGSKVPFVWEKCEVQ